MHLRFVALTLTVCALQPLSAQVGTRDGVRLRLTGQVHPQYNSTSIGAEPAHQMLLRRARLTVDVAWGWLLARVQPDMGGGTLAVKDAWVAYVFGPGLRARFGQFKRPFDLFELTSSSQILVVERAGGIRGLDTCSGVGGLCSFSRFTEQLEYADRDIGIEVSGTAGIVAWAAAVTNGAGANVADDNDAKSFTARAAFTVAPHVVVGANIAAHDYVHPVGGRDEHAVAFGGDVEVGGPGPGLHLQAGVVTGDNWQRPRGITGAARFVSAQAIVAYTVPLAGERIRALTPLARVSWGDPDREAGGDDGLLVTPGLDVDLGNRNRLAVNLDVWLPNTGETEYSLKVMQFLAF